MINKNQAWIVGAVAGAIAVVTGALKLWPVLGWQTPDGHDADMVVVEESHDKAQEPVLNAIEALSIKVDVQTDRWACDEDSEELVDLLKEQAVRHSIEREVAIEKIRNRMDVTKCTRFKD